MSKVSQNLMLPVDEIAYSYRDVESNFLRIMAGEDFFIAQSLDEVQQKLPEQKFFRANRQLIIHRKACKGFDLLSYGKLKAKVFPAHSSDVIISQKEHWHLRTGLIVKLLKDRLGSVDNLTIF